MEKEKIFNKVESLMSSYRWEHSKRVADYAVELAKTNYLSLDKAYMAGMLHDVAKEFSKKDLNRLVKDIPVAKTYPTWQTLHGLAGSVYIQEEFGITDQEIINAVADHVIPPKNCSTLSKIIYIADKLDEDKDKPIDNAEKIRDLAKINVNQAFDILKKTIELKYA